MAFVKGTPYENVPNRWWYHDNLDGLIIVQRFEKSPKYVIEIFDCDVQIAGPFKTLEIAKLTYMMLRPKYM